mgnify:CR=1 FL=1
MVIYIKDYKFNSNTSNLCLIILTVFYGIHYIIPYLKQIFLMDKSFEILSFNYREIVNIIISILAIPYITINVRYESSGIKEKIYSSMSYVIYLLHYPFILIYSYYIGGLNTTKKIPYFMVYFLCCITFSYLISIYFDQYFELRRSKYIKSFKLKNNL